MNEADSRRYGIVPVGSGEGSYVLRPDERPQPGRRLVLPHQITPAEALSLYGAGPKMTFPDRVLLTLDSGEQVFYPAGVHEVPESLSGHHWLKQCKVEPFVPPPPRKPVQPLTGKETRWLPPKP